MKMTTQWPRIRGQTGQIMEPEEYAGKWAWTIEILWEQFGVKLPEVLNTINSYELKKIRIFDSQELAENDLQKECDVLCELINKAAGGTGKEGFLDMQDGIKHKFSMEKK